MNKFSFLTNVPIAHRGLHGEVPENSLRAFEAAIKAGYVIETDVRLTKDGRLVVFHDDDLKRMTGDPRKVIDCTLGELSALRLNGTDCIPTFEEFLHTLSGLSPLLLEIKNVPEADTDAFIAQISAAMEGYRGEYAVQSFQPSYVKAYKRLRKSIPCGILATGTSTKADFGGSPLWRLKAFAVKHMSLNASVKPDFISYHFADLPTRETTRFKGPKLAWTIRSPQDEEYARKYADNIIFEGYLPTV